MIRLAAFLVFTAAVAAIAVWFADRPGEVVITWLGYRIDTSVAVLAGGTAAVAGAAVLLVSVLRLVVGAPAAIARSLARRRDVRGRNAITRGLVAIGAGDAVAARQFAAQAQRLAGDDPLVLLLTAQTAQLAGERDSADASFRKMAERPDTKLLGLRGLFIEAQRRHDPAARFFAEEAARTSPSLAWAGEAALQFRCLDGDWQGALEALERNRQGGLLGVDRFRRQRAVLLAARALSLDERERDTARELALEAIQLCPGLVPAAALAGRLLAEAGEPRKAGRVLEAAWRENPHPDLADAYANLVPGAAARDRLARARTLARLAAGHPESALAVARAALDAHEFAAARTALAPLSAQPTRRVATLMARLEEAEHGDTGRAREWMARAISAAHDPAWTADGLVSETWLPVSPASGRLDAFEWRVPLADLRGPVIEQPAPPAPPAPAPPAVLVPPAPRALADASAAAIDSSAMTAAAPDSGPAAIHAAIERAAVPTLAAASAHAPDDPGPEPEPAADPVPKAKPNGAARRSWFSW